MGNISITVMGIISLNHYFCYTIAFGVPATVPLLISRGIATFVCVLSCLFAFFLPFLISCLLVCFLSFLYTLKLPRPPLGPFQFLLVSLGSAWYPLGPIWAHLGTPLVSPWDTYLARLTSLQRFPFYLHCWCQIACFADCSYHPAHRRIHVSLTTMTSVTHASALLNMNG